MPFFLTCFVSFALYNVPDVSFYLIQRNAFFFNVFCQFYTCEPVVPINFGEIF